MKFWVEHCVSWFKNASSSGCRHRAWGGTSTAQRSVLPPPCPGCAAHSSEGMGERSWALCSWNVGLGHRWVFISHGHRSGTFSLRLYREQRTGHGQLFQLPGDFGMFHFKDCSFSRVEVPLSSDFQPHFSFHNAHLQNQLFFLFFFFFILNKAWLRKCPLRKL